MFSFVYTLVVCVCVCVCVCECVTLLSENTSAPECKPGNSVLGKEIVLRRFWGPSISQSEKHRWLCARVVIVATTSFEEVVGIYLQPRYAFMTCVDIRGYKTSYCYHVCSLSQENSVNS
jgi:hypothetical protein